MSTPPQRQLLERALDADPLDLHATVELARLLVREGEGERALGLLTACERTLIGASPFATASIAAPLAALRTCRMDLGLYHFHETCCLEWLCWPMRRRQQTQWEAVADAGWLWQRDALACDGRRLWVQSVRTDGSGESALSCFELATGRQLWRRETRETLRDVRLTPEGVLTWWTRGAGRLALLDPERGETLAEVETPAESWRQPLVELGHGVWGIARGPRSSADLGRVTLQPLDVEWSPLSEQHRAAELCVSIPRHRALDSDGRRISELLGIRTELLGIWRDTHEGTHLLFAWTLLSTARREYQLLNMLWRIAGDEVQPMRLPERWRHEPAIPRFFRLSGRWVATLELHRLRIDHGMNGPQITPMGALSQAAPDLWSFEDGATQVEALPHGHAGDSQALLAGGVWWQTREAPSRLVAYLTRGRMVGKTLTRIPLDARPSMLTERRLGWSRPAPLASQLITPLGPHLLVFEPTRLRCLKTGPALS